MKDDILANICKIIMLLDTEPYAVFPAPEADNLLKFLGLFGPTILKASLHARDGNFMALSCVIPSLALLGSEWSVGCI